MNLSFIKKNLTRIAEMLDVSLIQGATENLGKKLGRAFGVATLVSLLSLGLVNPALSTVAEQAQKSAQKGKSSKAVAKQAKSTKSVKIEKTATKKTKTQTLAQKNTKAAVKKNAVVKTVAAKNIKTNKTQKTASKKTVSPASRVAMAKSKKQSKRSSVRKVVWRRPTFGQQAGLHRVYDPLNLKSSSVLIRDVDTGEILFQKNADEVLPIASITKLMLGVVIAEAQLPMEQVVTIDRSDTRLSSTASSRLAAGMHFTRAQLIDLALMSSENRAAHALARSYPGGLEHAVKAMNQKALELGMTDTKYEEPTGLSNLNRSTAIDLVKLIAYASQIPMVSHSSTLPSSSFVLGKRLVNYHSTNRMIASGTWEIEAQKTGFISDAGQCLVMQTKIGGRRLGIALLDGVGHLARTVDSERIRAWVEGRLDGLDQDSFVSAKTAADRFDYAPRDWELPVQVVLQQEMSADDFARLSAGDLNEADTESVALEVINQEEGSDEISDEMSVVEAKSTQNTATKSVGKKDTNKLLADSVPTNSTAVVVSLQNNKHNPTTINSGAVSVKNVSAQTTNQANPTQSNSTNNNNNSTQDSQMAVEVSANQHLDGEAKKENNLIQKVKNVFLPAPVNVRPATSDKKMLQIQ